MRIFSSLIGAGLGIAILWSTDVPAQGQEKKLPPEIPKEFRGRWLLRTTSAEGGKKVKEEDGKPICNVTANQVKFVKKVDFSDQELKPVGVIKVKDDRGAPGYMIAFSNGKIWGISQKAGEKSVGVVIHDVVDKKPRESFRMVVHIEPVKMARTVWEYKGGAFRQEGKGKWVEKNFEGTFQFTEKERTAEHVDLYDSTRDYTVRLTENAMLIKGGNQTVQRQFKTFTKLQDGGWVE